MKINKLIRLSASFAAPGLALVGLLVAAAGSRADTVYESEYSYIEQFTASGAGSVFTNGLNNATGQAFDSAGNFYVANSGNTILKFTPAGVGSVFASTGLTGVQGLACDSAGNLYAANRGNNTIQRFTPAGVGSLFARASQGNAYPSGLAFDAGGNLYVAEQWVTNQIDGNDYFIEKITPAGTGALFGDFLSSPEGVAVDGAGNVYVANYSANTIVKFTPAGVRSTFASANLNYPWGLAFDSGGYLYVANFGGGIVKFAPDGSSSNFASYPTAHSPTFMAIQPGLSVFVSLSAQQSGSNIILSWPTNAVGYTLQSASSLGPPVTWIDCTNTPAVVGTSFTMTNDASAGSQFYRLKR